MRKLFAEYAHGGHVLVLVVFLELFSLLFYLSFGESCALFAEARAAQNLEAAAIMESAPVQEAETIDGETPVTQGETAGSKILQTAAEAAPVKTVQPQEGQEENKTDKQDFAITVNSNPEALKLIALTFDDGPGQLTGEYLAMLGEYGVKATFFVIGRHAEEYPNELLAIKQAGHEVGVHSMSHRQLNKLTLKEIKAEMQGSAAVVEKLTGEYPVYFRPPYGAFNKEVLDVAKELGQQNILWSVDPKDWRNPGAAAITARILKDVKPGDIIVMHENRKQTLEALPQIIEGIRSMGYDFGTVTEVLYDN
ncbi:polysaccharide deacetylase family protein [Zhaonella formicivorans]|uniref:polysaccharide deacetylase family protein n=1 Tax=Zhaonella formicivorans TaxID=2528593 RepID=UPI0010F0A114|nr:polysaccharide deacetylase family protein [Zhaonella formicivorans]